MVVAEQSERGDFVVLELRPHHNRKVVLKLRPTARSLGVDAAIDRRQAAHEQIMACSRKQNELAFPFARKLFKDDQHIVHAGKTAH
jgi:hypothetical protein